MILRSVSLSLISAKVKEVQPTCNKEFQPIGNKKVQPIGKKDVQPIGNKPQTTVDGVFNTIDRTNVYLDNLFATK